MNHRQQWQETAGRDNRLTSIRRTLDDSTDFHFYLCRTHCLRSGAAWDIISHMSRILPFFRNDEASTHPNDADCTML